MPGSQMDDDPREAVDLVSVRHAAMDLLARREHARLELQRKLLRRYPQELVVIALDGLAEDKLQSDERFAESYVRQRAERGFGPRRVQRELDERGVDADLASAALDASEIDWSEVAQLALTKKFGELPQDLAFSEKGRVLRFAEYRGFSRDHLPASLR